MEDTKEIREAEILNHISKMKYYYQELENLMKAQNKIGNINIYRVKAILEDIQKELEDAPSPYHLKSEIKVEHS